MGRLAPVSRHPDRCPRRPTRTGHSRIACQAEMPTWGMPTPRRQTTERPAPSFPAACLCRISRGVLAGEFPAPLSRWFTCGGQVPPMLSEFGTFHPFSLLKT